MDTHSKPEVADIPDPGRPLERRTVADARLPSVSCNRLESRAETPVDFARSKSWPALASGMKERIQVE